MGNGAFIAASMVVSALLSFVVIPRATQLMVNNAAGLAGRHLGKSWRTLCINASTNNPEAAAMLVSFGMRKMGGWSNPLGSLLANVYLMYLAGFAWVALKLAIKGDRERLRQFLRLLRAEWRLLLGHLAVSLVLFAFGFSALRVMMSRETMTPLDPSVALVAVLLILGIAAFVVFEMILKRRRIELFDDMDESGFTESWGGLLAGTLGVIAACWVMNALFLGWSVIYSGSLSGLFGPMIFAWLHYFLGSLITSLPELTVTVHNLEKLRAPDLNTALGSVSYSNMVNLAIALLGLILWVVFTSLGVSFSWT
ncbi:MAG: hypothetical protein PWP23_1446 [Candidatus Sumerlaeota bacterium]|nr:hypothetical protein [Candidatus Sumerlaeota bacterium]